MGVQVDQPRRDDEAGDVALCRAGAEAGAERGHLAVGESHVEHRVDALGGIHHPPAAQHQIEHASFPFLPSSTGWSGDAAISATPSRKPPGRAMMGRHHQGADRDDRAGSGGAAAATNSRIVAAYLAAHAALRRPGRRRPRPCSPTASPTTPATSTPTASTSRAPPGRTNGTSTATATSTSSAATAR